MHQLGLMPLLIREVLGKRTLPREPEPEMVMDGPEQVAAYFDCGKNYDGIMAVSSLFHAAHATVVIKGCKRVLDLGCGPATQLVRIAELNPDIEFVGVDLSAEMLRKARDLVTNSNLTNVDITQADITRLEQIGDNSFDGVVSTATLHHLPRLDNLRNCFLQINRVLKPGGAIYLSDFCRLKSLKSVLYFAYKYRKQLPHILCLDYERSLRAAFLVADFELLLAELNMEQARLYSASIVPFMMVIKSQDRTLEPEQKQKICQMLQTLTRAYRRELDDLRTFFRLNGLSDQIFKHCRNLQ